MPNAIAMPQSRSTALAVSPDLVLGAPGADLNAYITAVSGIPVLSQDEELALARRLRDHADLDAARRLVMAHLRFVVHIARGYRGYGLPLGDLVQEGNVGLMKAVKRFDPEQGVRLVSFAVHWIRAEIHEFVLRNWRIVKVATTKAQRKLFFNLRSSRRRLGWMNQAEVETIAADLGVKPEEVMEMESRLAGQDVTFDPAPADDEDNTYAPAAYLHAPAADPAQQIEAADWEDANQTRLLAALDSLDERSRAIVSERWLGEDKPTLHDLAARYQVSAERIRQIEAAAIRKLRNAMA